MDERLQRIEELSRQAMIHAKNADRRAEAAHQRVSEGFHELELALTKLTITVDQVVKTSGGRDGFSDREKWIMKILILTVIALIVLAFGKAGIEAVATWQSLSKGIGTP